MNFAPWIGSMILLHAISLDQWRSVITWQQWRKLVKSCTSDVQDCPSIHSYMWALMIGDLAAAHALRGLALLAEASSYVSRFGNESSLVIAPRQIYFGLRQLSTDGLEISHRRSVMHLDRQFISISTLSWFIHGSFINPFIHCFDCVLHDIHNGIHANKPSILAEKSQALSMVKLVVAQCGSPITIGYCWLFRVVHLSNYATSVTRQHYCGQYCKYGSLQSVTINAKFILKIITLGSIIFDDFCYYCRWLVIHPMNRSSHDHGQQQWLMFAAVY